LNLTARQIGHRHSGVDDYYWKIFEDPSHGLYVSKCVCKGANGAVTRWQRESEVKLEEREETLRRIRSYEEGR
jgi:hypothetical protein